MLYHKHYVHNIQKQIENTKTFSSLLHNLFYIKSYFRNHHMGQN